MNGLASRKQLLVAESELNRAQLIGDVAELKAGMRALTDRANTFGAIVSSAATLVAGLAASGGSPRANADAKPSWLQTIVKGAGFASTVWQVIRSKRSAQRAK